MAATYNTPGVYIEEISNFPPSIAAVETAIPAFIGYTQIAIQNGNSLTNVPTKISSLLEYQLYFGTGFSPQEAKVTLDQNNNYAVLSVVLDQGKRFYLYDSVRLFYDNGGGDCYIVSVGFYTGTTGAVNAVALADFETGLDAVEREDEPTILLFPDAGSLASNSDFYNLQQAALMQCAKLQDRVSIFDLYEKAGATSPVDAAADFRTYIGINNLNYGNAYTPWLYASYDRDVDYSMFHDTTADTNHGVFLSDGTTKVTNLATLTSNSDTNALVTTLENANADVDTINKDITSLSGTSPSVDDAYKTSVNAVLTAPDDATMKTNLKALLTFVSGVADSLEHKWNSATYFKGTQLSNDVKSYSSSNSLWRGGVLAFLGVEKNPTTMGLTGLDEAAIEGEYHFTGTSWLGALVSAAPANNAHYDTPSTAVKDETFKIVSDINAAYNKISAFINSVLTDAQTYASLAQTNLYNNHPIISNIVNTIALELNTLPPSGAMAGVYAAVDAARGVWKAPANVSLNSVNGPVYNINNDEQGSLNVDTLAGKSINAIRAFVGRGILVWGARTLAGNDDNWRYISVRRFLIMVEQSCKNAAGSFVFEPNDGNTWAKVQGMIENFLTLQWRAGALQGAKASDAFAVAVGLNKTMSAIDILEGRMIVEIRLAVVHPAEFIILRFSQMMAQS
jgi:Bacteriophage tail sheath protein